MQKRTIMIFKATDKNKTVLETVFHVVVKRSCNSLIIKSITKGYLLARKRPPFRVQKATFYNAICDILENKSREIKN